MAEDDFEGKSTCTAPAPALLLFSHDELEVPAHPSEPEYSADRRERFCTDFSSNAAGGAAIHGPPCKLLPPESYSPDVLAQDGAREGAGLQHRGTIADSTVHVYSEAEELFLEDHEDYEDCDSNSLMDMRPFEGERPSSVHYLNARARFSLYSSRPSFAPSYATMLRPTPLRVPPPASPGTTPFPSTHHEVGSNGRDLWNRRACRGWLGLRFERGLALSERGTASRQSLAAAVGC